MNALIESGVAARMHSLKCAATSLRIIIRALIGDGVAFLPEEPKAEERSVAARMHSLKCAQVGLRIIINRKQHRRGHRVAGYHYLYTAFDAVEQLRRRV